MQKIFVYSIAKGQKDCFSSVNDEFKKQISRFACIKEEKVFNKQIEKAQKISSFEAKKSYTSAFEKYQKGFCIALDERGKEFNSIEFSKIFDKESDIRFFIGGAYGFEEKFIKKSHIILSLSRLTFAHKIALSVLLEQIYRALSIKNAHPYHK